MLIKNSPQKYTDTENLINFTEELDRLRNLPGFPIGQDEDILALSRPPYYTACPNPFVGNFISEFSLPYHAASDTYCREPFAADIATQERHPVYAAHPYHTKVPPEIIRTLINHFCEEGGIVFDGFCGSGMTGVAALETGRAALLADLSPVATFISAVNTTYFGADELAGALEAMLGRVEEKLGALYQTEDEAGNKSSLNYAIWSDVFSCPKCRHEFPFFPHAVIQHVGKVETRRQFPCPGCGNSLSVRMVERIMTATGKKKALVWVSRGKQAGPPSAFDLALANQIEQMEVPAWYPADPIDPAGYTAQLAQLGAKAINRVDRFLSRRNLIIFSSLMEEARTHVPAPLRNACIYALTGIFTVISERQGYFGGGGGMSGNLYMPIVRMERNIFGCLRRKIKKLRKAEERKKAYQTKAIISTQSSHHLPLIPDNSIDYIYTDPPFGANIIYSEMNLLLESWLKVKTNDKLELVVNTTRDTGLDYYQKMLRAALAEFYRILKPRRWITIEFHNTKAVIWNVVQQALEAAGFIVAHVGLLDKGSSTILQDIRDGAVYQDLLISAYKQPVSRLTLPPTTLATGTEEGVWQFVRDYLAELPLSAPDRRAYTLYSRMVAYHLQHGLSVPISASKFYVKLAQNFKEVDRLYFLETVS